jgi:hypothetical protein
MKIFAILTAVALTVAALLFAAPQEVPWRAMLFAAQDAGPSSKPPMKKNAGGEAKQSPSAKEKKEKEDDAATRRQTAQYAANLLTRCRDKFGENNDATYHADIDEEVHIGGRSFTAKGEYWKGSGRRFRLELNMVIGEGKDAVKARLLQVCDGEVLMTEQVMGKKKRYTRRNVKQILAAAATAAQVPSNKLVSEFGLGGIGGLIASLQQSMVFDTSRSIPTKDKPAIQIEGGWNNNYATHWVNWARQTGLQRLPAHVPDRVRVLVDSDHNVRKIEYLRTAPDGKSFTPLLSLSLLHIELNPRLDDKKLFQHDFEPTAYPRDTTAQYIQLFQPRPAGKN